MSYKKKKDKVFDPLTEQKENDKFILEEHEKAMMQAILRHGALPMPHWTEEEIESWRRGEQIEPNRNHKKAKASLMSMIMEWMAQVLAMMGLGSNQQQSKKEQNAEPAKQHATYTNTDKDADRNKSYAEKVQRNQSHVSALEHEKHGQHRGM